MEVLLLVLGLHVEKQQLFLGYCPQDISLHLACGVGCGAWGVEQRNRGTEGYQLPSTLRRAFGWIQVVLGLRLNWTSTLRISYHC